MTTTAPDLATWLETTAAERGIAIADLEAAMRAQIDQIAARAATGHRFRDHLERVEHVAHTRTHLDREWRTAIGEAVAAGAPRQLVANAAGVTRQRIGQVARDYITAQPSDD